MARTRAWTPAAIALVLVAGFVLSRYSQQSPPATGRIVAQTSKDWGSIPFADGQCAVVNNTWNKAGAGNEFEQSVFLAEVSRKTTVG